jgi:dephospho-CoA kinase
MSEGKTSKPLLIGLTGYARHGKSTIANMFKVYGFKEYALAGPLKRACMEIFGLTEEQVFDDEKKKEIDRFWNVTPREVLQKVGTELFRDKLHDAIPDMNLGEFNIVWIRMMEQFIENERKKNPSVNIVISDVRNIDEAKAIKKLGGYIIRIHNPRVKMNEDFRSHASEQMVDKIRFEGMILNDSSLVDLFQDVDSFVSALTSDLSELVMNYEDYCNPSAKGIVMKMYKNPIGDLVVSSEH